MAHFQIDETTWVKNYSNTLKVRGANKLSLSLVLFCLCLIDVGCIVLRQYLGAVLITLAVFRAIREFWFNRERKARSIYAKAPITSVEKEVIFSSSSILIHVGGNMFELAWEGIKRVIKLPELLYLEHSYFNLYILSTALSPAEISTITEKITALGIKTE